MPKGTDAKLLLVCCKMARKAKNSIFYFDDCEKRIKEEKIMTTVSNF